jgi:hypothetical protein
MEKPVLRAWEKIFLMIGVGALLCHILLMPWTLPEHIRIGILLLASIGIVPVFVTQFIIRPLRR